MTRRTHHDVPLGVALGLAAATFSGSTRSDQSGLHAADMQEVAAAQSVVFINLTRAAKV